MTGGELLQSMKATSGGFAGIGSENIDRVSQNSVLDPGSLPYYDLLLDG